MHISWLGHSVFKIETKTTLKEEVVVLLNPYLSTNSDLPRNLKSDIVLLTNGPDNTITLSGDPFIISTPGEYELNGVMIYSIPVAPQTEKEPQQIIFHIETESMSVTYLGNFKGKVNNELADKLGVVDILLLPCGDKTLLAADEASTIVNALEPRVVIPHSFNQPGGKDPFEPVDKFAKLQGQKELEWLPKFKVSKRDLPQEDTKLVLLNKI